MGAARVSQQPLGVGPGEVRGRDRRVEGAVAAEQGEIVERPLARGAGARWAADSVIEGVGCIGARAAGLERSPAGPRALPSRARRPVPITHRWLHRKSPREAPIGSPATPRSPRSSPLHDDQSLAESVLASVAVPTASPARCRRRASSAPTSSSRASPPRDDRVAQRTRPLPFADAASTPTLARRARAPARRHARPFVAELARVAARRVRRRAPSQRRAPGARKVIRHAYVQRAVLRFRGGWTSTTARAAGAGGDRGGLRLGPRLHRASAPDGQRHARHDGDDRRHDARVRRPGRRRVRRQPRRLADALTSARFGHSTRRRLHACSGTPGRPRSSTRARRPRRCGAPSAARLATAPGSSGSAQRATGRRCAAAVRARERDGADADDLRARPAGGRSPRPGGAEPTGRRSRPRPSPPAPRPSPRAVKTAAARDDRAGADPSARPVRQAVARRLGATARVGPVVAAYLAAPHEARTRCAWTRTGTDLQSRNRYEMVAAGLPGDRGGCAVGEIIGLDVPYDRSGTLEIDSAADVRQRVGLERAVEPAAPPAELVAGARVAKQLVDAVMQIAHRDRFLGAPDPWTSREPLVTCVRPGASRGCSSSARSRRS